MDDSSSEGNESSDYDKISTSELSTSSESSSKEQSCSWVKEKDQQKHQNVMRLPTRLCRPEKKAKGR